MKKENFITTSLGIGGYFAVMMYWNPKGFWEPWTTGFGRYETKAEAEVEAREWAKAEGLEFRE